MSVPGVMRRPVTTSDEAFLRRLYADSRAREMVLVDWTDEQKQAFLAQQFQAQSHYYHEHYPDCERSILLVDGEPAGRLYVDRRDEEIRVIDIALLAGFQRRGIGGALMREVLEEGRASRRPVRIHVERENPAYRLYTRLGFVKIGESGVYDLLEVAPD